MALAHAVMTSLLEKPSSGYDLARRFDKSIGYFWHATHQQIYRELGRMEAAGWIASEAAPDGGRTRKRLYRVLEAGVAELRRWVAEPGPAADVRDELLVRLRADAVVGPLGLDAEIERRQALHRSRLAAYRAIEARDFAPDTLTSREARVRHLILRTGILHEENWVKWSQEALAVLRDEAAVPASRPPSKAPPRAR